MTKPKSTYRVLAQNKKARFNYEILEVLEAGLVLLGGEVKALRKGLVSIQEGYIEFRAEGEAYLVNSHINEYAFSSYNSHDPLRARKLLLHKKEIIKLQQRVKLKGMTIVPLKIYINDKNLIKLEIGLGKGKTLYDKRSVLKERQARKDTDKMLKNYNTRSV